MEVLVCVYKQIGAISLVKEYRMSLDFQEMQRSERQRTLTGIGFGAYIAVPKGFSLGTMEGLSEGLRRGMVSSKFTVGYTN
jgi:hypothetical protein